MGQEIASLYADIGADLTGLDKGLAGAEAGLQRTAEGLSGLDKQVNAFGVNLGTTRDLLGGLGVALPTSPMQAFGQAIAFSVGEAAEAEAVLAQTNAVIKSTGGAAGVTADQVVSLASALQNQSRFADDAIQKGENLLLTFTNIGGDVFPEATQAMVDMAAALGTDVAGGAIQLGKALNDPVAGITALQRVGVSFTAEQKRVIAAMVQTGDVAGAQKIILAELNKEFGGSAAASAKTYAGSIDQAKNALADLGEVAGGAVLPVLTEGITAFTDWARTISAGVDALQDGRWSLLDWVQASAEVVWTGKTLGDVQAELAAGSAEQARVVEAETGRWQGLAAQYATTTTAATEFSNQIQSQTQWLEDTKVAQYDAAAAAAAQAEATRQADQAIGDLNTSMAAAIDSELADYQQSQSSIRDRLGEVTAKIGELNGQTYLTDAQRAELADLKTQQAELQTSYNDTANAHDVKVKRILFGMIEEKLAYGGYTDEEIAGLKDIATQWGLTGALTAEAVQLINDKFSEGAQDVGLAADDIVASATGIANTLNGVTVMAVTTTKDAMIEAAEKADGYRDALNKLNGLVVTNEVHTNYTSSGTNVVPNSPQVPYVPPPSAPPGYTPPQPIPQATGGDWMVSGPTLFLAGEAGPERATFTPLGGGSGGGGGDSAELVSALRSLPGMVGRAVRDAIAGSR